jgi:serine/threonine protein kinase/formylglycine-generating enzyme required for sulfatase activity
LTEKIDTKMQTTTMPGTISLGKSVAATKLIKDVLKVEPSVDLEHISGRSSDPQTDPSVGESPKSVRDIISQAQKDTKYIVNNVIGQGGMGAVLGTIDQDIRRKVAMKVMRPENRRDTLKIRRFLEEAQVTGQLEHPNIVPVHEIGIDENAHVYFTMKLVQGEDLESVITKCADGNEEYEKKYALGILLQLFMKVVDGMSYAHAKGVLHRDLKPENIMIGNFGEVLVMDWGIAKILGQGSAFSNGSAIEKNETDRQTMTMEGRIMGTPAYMSPEQACGRISELDPRSDVFSLGAILYKILTRCQPYEGASVQATLEQAQGGELVPPDLRTPQRNIPPELTAICMKAMAYEKEDRYADAAEINADLQLYLDGKSVSAKKDSLLIKTRKWIARNRIASAGIAAAFICLMAGIAAASMYQNRLRQEKIAGLLNKASSYIALENFESAEKTFFAVLGLDSDNPQARKGISSVSGKSLAAKNRHLAQDTLAKAESLFANAAYQDAYDAYVATLALDPYSRDAREKIQVSAVMADKQKMLDKIPPILEETAAIKTEIKTMRSEAEQLETELKTMRTSIKGYEGRQKKTPLWTAEKKLASLNIEILKKESLLISKYMTVLSYDGMNADARQGLSGLYYDRFTTGERLQRIEDMAFYRSLVLTFDDGFYRDLLETPGRLTLTATPEPDAYELQRLVPGKDRRLVPEQFRPTDGSSTMHRVENQPLPPGSYLVTLKRKAYLDTKVPIRIQRGENLEVTGIRLFRKTDLPEGFIYIPKGPFLMGGDEAAPYALGHTSQHVPGFFISRHEITAGEYLTFVNDMEKRIPGSAKKYLPRKSSNSGHYWKKSGNQYTSNFPAKWPILGISWNDARAFCKWMTHKYKNKGWVFRLPEEREWEKAARGADGRYFPWGNHFDYTFCSMANSKEKKPNGPDPVGSYKADRSIYGVMDMAGNVSEWCNTFYDQRNNIRINRGAAWSFVEADYARCAARNGHSPSDVADFRGFRMAVSLP